MSEVEEWRPVVGWEGFYEVSSLGRVRSIDRAVKVSGCDKYRAPKRDYIRWQRGTVLAQMLRRDGYLKVGLHGGGVKEQPAVHRLVCAAFHGPPMPNRDAAHGDGVKTNNRADNLRWASRAENLADKVAHGTDHRGERSPSAKLSPAQVLKIREELRNGATQRGLAAQYRVSVSAIHLISNGKNWKHLP